MSERGAKSPPAIWAVLIAIVTVGCGGEGQTGTVVGPAGGTVSGPNGAKVVIPPGALTADTAIAIEQTSAGAPALPGGFSAFGQMYAFTPHGTLFAVPVTVTVPFDAASVPAGVTPGLFKTNAQDQWEQVANVTVDADTVSAQVLSFSYGTAGIHLDTLGAFFDFYNERTRQATEGNILGFIGEPPPMCDFLHDSDWFADCAFGEAPFDLDDGEITLEVFYDNTGDTFWASADDVGRAHLHLGKCYRKISADATLAFVISKGRLEAVDFNSLRPDYCPQSVGALRLDPQMKGCGQVLAIIKFEARATNNQGGLLLGADGKAALDTGGYMSLNGRSGLWDILVARILPYATAPWTYEDFDITKDKFGDPGEIHPLAQLNHDIVLDVDLSTVGVKDYFCVAIDISANAENANPLEQWVGAFLRDPLRIGGTAVNTTGLELSDERPLPPPCATPDPTAGVLQFSAATYSMAQNPLAGLSGVVVTRTQGSTGAVSATVTTGGGTATPRLHYWPLATSVYFADGDTATRTVPLDILSNAQEEPDQTVNVTLSAPTGCATLGPQSSAVVTILDDDRPPVTPSHTVGGTVTGLVGTGLVLTSAGLNLSPGNGPFTFPQPLPVGIPYNVLVVTQPTNPNQVCTVINGSGTIGDADVTNVAVDCVTSPTNGALDPSFGSGGKVTGPGGGVSAMALQASDGKIVVVGGQTLARYNGDGSPDMPFGPNGNGTVAVDFNGGLAQGVTIQPDGGIVVVGFTTNVATQVDFAVARYLGNGKPDMNFGTGGKISTDFNFGADQAWAVLVQTDGKIVVAGSAAASPSLPVDNDFAVARYTSAGVLDSSFGSFGKVTTNIAGRTDLAYAAVLSSDGKIVLAGRVAVDGSANPDVGLVRYKTDGSLDMSFGGGGIVRQDVSSGNWDEASDLAMQPDGKIVVAAQAVVGGKYSFAVARFGAAGSLDGTFGIGGVATVAFTTEPDVPQAVAVQPDGKIVVAGRSSNRMNADFAVARFDAGGTLDPSFGTGGKVTADFFGFDDGAEYVAVQPDGKIVMAGFASIGFVLSFALARANP